VAERNTAALLMGVLLLGLTGRAGFSAEATASSPTAAGATHHYLYVFPVGSVDIYDMDHSFRLVKRISLLPTSIGVRGAGVHVAGHSLYLSYGGAGGSTGTGSLLRYDLLSNRVQWMRHYAFGIDSLAITPNGRKMYLPTGESTEGDSWEVIHPSDGEVIGVIHAENRPHDTVVSLNGRHVYMSGAGDEYLMEASTATDRVIKKIGPLLHGIRPFTINGRETLAFTTEDDFLGFQVSDIRSGRVLYTVPVQGFSFPPSDGLGNTPSHGIALSPDEKQVWVIDQPNSYVHVFDVSKLPGSQPRQVDDIRLTGHMEGNESPCAYYCERTGWLGMSRNGRFLLVGDAGDVIDTRTRRTVAVLPALYNARVFLEIDFRRGTPVFATRREAIGYITG